MAAWFSKTVLKKSKNPLPDGLGSEALVFACHELPRPESEGTVNGVLFQQHLKTGSAMRPRLISTPRKDLV